MRQRRPFEQLLLARFRAQQMIPAGARVAVAVSGGADSVALFRIVKSIHEELGITCSVAHFDHLLRGAESAEDSQFVAKLAAANGVDFFIERADVAAQAHRQKWNLEDAARRLRYGFFHRLVEQGHATHVAVAHTADDQAETLLAHLIRGTGPRGLAGIYPEAGPIIRPLLGVRRQELREYLAALGQTWREDSTNADSTRLRSRIRLQLVPQLRDEFSSRIVEHLCALAQLSREEGVFWDALVERCRHALVQPGAGNSLTIRVADLLSPLAALVRQPGLQSPGHTDGPAEGLALTERLTRRIYEQVKGDCQGLTLTHIQQVIRLASTSTSGRSVLLPGGIRIQRNFETLVFSRDRTASTRQSEGRHGRGAAYQYPISLEVRKTVRISVREIGICLHLKTVDWGKTRSETTGETQVLDVDLIQAPLILRNWLPGDAYTPCGRSRPRKLNRMLLAAHVPNADRKSWPVLVSAGQLIWARGLPPARDFCAGEQTRIALVIEVKGIE